MKPNLIFTSILILAGQSCMQYTGIYKVELQNVERPENAKERYGDSKIVNFEEEDKAKYSYEDDMIKIVFDTQFGFTLKNKTNHSIKIIWDQAGYVDLNGSSGRVMHAGVNYTDRNNSQPPTVIVKNATIDDMIIPTDKIWYDSGQYYIGDRSWQRFYTLPTGAADRVTDSGQYYVRWGTTPMIPSYIASTQKKFNALTQQNHIGKEVKVLLPLKIEETINEYIFIFKLTDLIQFKIPMAGM